MSWQPCDSGGRLRSELVSFIETWIRSDDYKSRLPDEHIHILKPGEQQASGVNVVLVSETDPQRTWPHIPGDGMEAGRVVIEEYHLIAVVVKADKVNGGANSVSAVHGIIRSIFSCPENEPERVDLINRGVYNLFESPDGALDVSPGADDEEGTFFSKTVSLECSTDMLSK